jgi:hypothetical protein
VPSPSCSFSLSFSFSVVLLSCGLALAEDPPESWADPTLQDALAAARIVVRGHVQAPATGESQPRLAIEKVVAGKGTPGVSVPLWGTKRPASLDNYLAPLRAGDEGIFILRQTGDPTKARLELPTPSYGAFVIRSGFVGASVRDTAVRVPMRADAYEAFLAQAWAHAHEAPADAAFLDSCRATLGALDPRARESAVAAHIALEGLAFGAQEKDADLALRFGGAPAFQVRVSAARVLERAGGGDAGEALLHLALDDPDPVVQAYALLSLGRVKPIPSDAVPRLLARVTDLKAVTTPLHVDVYDPRTNEAKAPMVAAFETLRALGGGEAAIAPALDLLAKDDADTLVAACFHLAKMKAKDKALAIAEKMRPKGYPYTFSNETIAKLLEELTDAKRGEDREAWLEYLRKPGEPPK